MVVNTRVIIVNKTTKSLSLWCLLARGGMSLCPNNTSYFSMKAFHCAFGPPLLLFLGAGGGEEIYVLNIPCSIIMKVL